jgi:hypothetical protein
MPCSHCGIVGHTYLKCPQLSEQEKKEKKEEIKKKKEEINHRKMLRERHHEVHKTHDYTFVNNNMYEVVVYWAFSNIPENYHKTKDKFIRTLYIPPMEQRVIPLCKLYRIAIFPVLEVPHQTTVTNARKIITIDENYKDLFKLLDIDLINYPDKVWEVKREYDPPKTEIEQWKEFALKSHYLLKEMEKMTGGGKCKMYENLEPFMDMIQDIPIPRNITEADKEKAGVPSALTNIT